MTARFDIAIAGAGIAGASLAAALVGSGAAVLMLEGEAQPGYHATGRSAAFWTESYGGPEVQPLTTASGPALRAGGYLSPRGALTIARAGDEQELEAFAARYAALGVCLERLGREAREETSASGQALGLVHAYCRFRRRGLCRLGRNSNAGG